MCVFLNGILSVLIFYQNGSSHHCASFCLFVLFLFLFCFWFVSVLLCFVVCLFFMLLLFVVVFLFCFCFDFVLRVVIFHLGHSKIREICRVPEFLLRNMCL